MQRKDEPGGGDPPSWAYRLAVDLIPSDPMDSEARMEGGSGAGEGATRVLDRLLERHRIEAKQLRQELGDPREALADFVREHYNQDLLAEAFDDLIGGGNVWDADRATGGR